MSDFFVFTIFARREKIQYPGAMTIQRIIEVGLGELNDTHFAQIDSTGATINRYENSIGFYFGWKIAGIAGLYISPQHIVDKQKSSSGQAPTIDNFVNGVHNKFIEMVSDGSELWNHFAKFLLDSMPNAGKKYKDAGRYREYCDNFVILDIVLTNEVPREIPDEFKFAVDKYYSFVKSTNTLYHAGKVVKTGVSIGLQHHQSPTSSATAINNTRAKRTAILSTLPRSSLRTFSTVRGRTGGGDGTEQRLLLRKYAAVHPVWKLVNAITMTCVNGSARPAHLLLSNCIHEGHQSRRLLSSLLRIIK